MNAPRFAEQVEAVVHAVRFQSALTYTWLGTIPPGLEGPARTTMAPEDARALLMHKLQAQLYEGFYCPGFPRPIEPQIDDIQEAGLPPFVQQLSDANSGTGYPSDGWIVRDIQPGQLMVNKEGLELWVNAYDCLVSPDTAIVPGMSLALRFPKEFLSLAPGSYVACGNHELEYPEPHVLVRLYWNLTADGAVRFIALATAALNHAGVPFKIKAVNSRARFTRCDAVVLYFRKADFPRVFAPLAKLYPEISGHLRHRVPALTKRLAPGVGLAEDPGEGDSYGSHRCRILAEGLIRARERGQTGAEARLRIVRECFEEKGINWDLPFLTSSVIDEYDFHPEVVISSREAPATEYSSDAFLAMAVNLGQSLVKSAVWHDGCCNWVGSVNAETWSRPTRLGRQYAALGPDLYAGTSGIAWFLAELYAATGSAPARACAVAAVRQALTRVNDLGQCGLYTGWMGVALAAAHVGTVVGDDELVQGSRHVVARQYALDPAPGEAHFDVIAGKAGAVIGLVRLADLLGDEKLIEYARRYGDDLLHSAKKSDFGYSWPCVGNHRNLTGFAHGAAGVSFALIELFRVTGKVLYREAAERAIDYERHHFDVEAGNWPDFRRMPGEKGRYRKPQRFSSTWCHGAPGIAVSRLRAYEVLKCAVYREEALTALETTSTATVAWLQPGTSSYSLCHGLFGNADILLFGKEVLGQECTGSGPILKAIGDAAQRDEGASLRHDYESDDPPGLMLGVAGRGYFFLRLHSSRTPSVLGVSTPL